ncbi:hypothetical protein, partial [Nocardioides hungaricus]
TTTPTPTTTPTIDPVTREDLALGSGSYTRYSSHYHVQMSVAALLDPTLLTIEAGRLTSFRVHDQSSYLPAGCTQTGSDGETARLTCEVPPGQGTFAIDLVASQLEVTVRVSAPGNEDPDPLDDRLAFASAGQPVQSPSIVSARP